MSLEDAKIKVHYSLWILPNKSKLFKEENWGTLTNDYKPLWFYLIRPQLPATSTDVPLVIDS
jgi:hypothetical protein